MSDLYKAYIQLTIQTQTWCNTSRNTQIPDQKRNPNNMSYSYVVSSQRSTAVSHSIVCSFSSPGAKNLVVAKGNYLLVYLVSEDALTLLTETPLFGKIKCLDFYRPANLETDALFVLTERKSFCVLGYDAATGKLTTRAVGNVRDRAGRDVEIGQRGLVDPNFRMIGMVLYEGQLKVKFLWRDTGRNN